jgi:hypothetical protein
LIRVLPDGFTPLFRPAAALPGPLLMPLSAGLPVALPVVVPVVGEPIVVPVAAAPPVAELPAVPPPVDCANAQVPVKASAVASPNAASFMVAPFSCCIEANEVHARCVPDHRSRFVAVPIKIFAGEIESNPSLGALWQRYVSPSGLKIAGVSPDPNCGFFIRWRGEASCSFARHPA